MLGVDSFGGYGGGGHGGSEPLLLLLLALIIEAFVGDPPALFRAIPHPVAAFGRLVDALEKRLNREERSPRNRAVRGAVVVVFLA
ncbi:MAG: cobalamin biosynthesis protein, partial [Alphaproteobacteria bacterium]